MDCMKEWEQLGFEVVDREMVPTAEWLSIGETVLASSVENRWLTITHLAKHYYAKTGIGKLIDWKAMIVEITLETQETQKAKACDQAFKLGRLEGMEVVMAASRRDDALDLGSSVQYKDDMQCQIRSIPTNSKPRKHLQIKGQLGLYPEGRA